MPDPFVDAGLDGVRYLRLKACDSRSYAHFAWKRDASDPLLREFVAFALPLPLEALPWAPRAARMAPAPGPAGARHP